jgi:hypothetical protein
VRAGRACRRDGGVGTFRTKAHGDLAGRQVHERGDDEKRRHPIGSTFEQDVMLAFDDFKAADATPDRDAHARRVLRTDLKTARSDRHRRGGQRELNEPTALLEVLLVEPCERVEAFHFAGKARGVARGVEQGDRRNPRSSGENRLPRRFGPHPERRYQPHTGDDHPPTTASRSFH